MTLPGILASLRSTLASATLPVAFLLVILGSAALWTPSADAQSPTPVTTIKNENADTRFQLDHGGGLLLPGSFVTDGTENDSIPASGAGTRLMWYPAKAAFRAGRVGNSTAGTEWDAPNVGEYSVALGMDVEASGESSVALGAGTAASAPTAAAMGSGTTASGIGTTAIGSGTTAAGFAAIAMGNATTASGRAATAMGGLRTTASGDRALAVGDEATASGNQAIAMGTLTNANAADAVAIGNRTTASAPQSVAMNQGTTASGNGATAMGFQTDAATALSLSMGECNSANASDDNTLLAVGNGTFSILDGRCLPRSDALVLDASGNLEISGTLTESSDRRLKTSIRPMTDETIPKLSRLRPVRYQFKNQKTHPSGEQIGLIAQDVQEEFPALVRGGDDDALALSYSKFTAVLLKGLQEQQSVVDSLNERVQHLESLESRIARLEETSSPVLPAGATDTILIAGLLFGVGLLWHRRRT